MKTLLCCGLALLLVAGSLAACSMAPAAQQTPAVGASIDTARPVAAPAEPEIDWDHPFKGQGRTNVDPSALAAAPQSFGTTIDPVTPQLSSGKLRWVDVSPAGTVAYMFDFSGDPGFPSDGRVAIEESQSDMTEGEYINGGDWAGTDNTVTSVGAITILVRSNKGLADASFVHDGTLYDIKGVELGPVPALSIATQLAHQLN